MPSCCIIGCKSRTGSGISLHRLPKKDPQRYLEWMKNVNKKSISKHAMICAEEDTPEPQYLEALTKYFGHRSFRPLQWQIISAVIKDKRDVYNIPACLLGSAQAQKEKVVKEIFSNEYRMIYLTPEFCTGEMGRDLLRKMNRQLNINLIAIDEAHCISTWGHDFRHHYRELGFLRKLLPQVPIMAVTATATRRVRQDIICSLNLRNPLLLVSSFNRPNLYFQVHPKGSSVYKDLCKIMGFKNSGWSFSGPTIIYCLTRKKTGEITQNLRVAGINCRPFHAGLPLRTRQEVHEDFIKDKIDVIVATTAFGMGIDKPNIRNVVHFGAFMSIESFYQGAGRAGRDGLPANWVVFFSSADFITIRNIGGTRGGNVQQKKNNLKAVQEYLNTKQCRRKFILRYFEDADDLVEPQSNCCDNCTKNLLVQENYLLEEARKTQQGFSYCPVSLTSKGKKALASRDSEIMLSPSAQLRPKPQIGRINCKPGPSLSLKMDAEIDDEEKMALYKKLLDVRVDLAMRSMQYNIASNSALMKMAQLQPKTREELRHLNLDGFTEGKIMKFGNTFLKIINDYTVKKPIKKSEDVSNIPLDAVLIYAEQDKNEEDSDDTDIENEPPQKKEKTESKTDLKTDYDIILDSPPQIRVEFQI